jgi:hypothetical protein
VAVNEFLNKEKLTKEKGKLTEAKNLERKNMNIQHPGGFLHYSATCV